ncbi:aromatic-ring-hydroxylating dioxygenase subunit beta [Roseomonas sp. CCTCC AB2023176]|uniref:aromatic-ring-hydroxylating dioxygenase subunit beta n=1 Tax=Roseomonas sp. CCTCC AB2023176 TaxID=3342640 RepID=UPI0035DCCF7C
MSATLERPSLHALTALVIRETELLDTWRLDDWLALYAPVCAYWVPSQWDQRDPHATISHIYDDRRLLETRVRRFKHAMFHAQKPPSRTLRFTANHRAGEGPDTLLCHYEVAEFRNLRHRRYVARATYDFAPERDGGLLIARKRLDLLDCDAVQDGISIIL